MTDGPPNGTAPGGSPVDYDRIADLYDLFVSGEPERRPARRDEDPPYPRRAL